MPQEQSSKREQIPPTPEGLIRSLFPADKVLVDAALDQANVEHFKGLVMQTIIDVQTRLEQDDSQSPAIRQLGIVQEHFGKGISYLEIGRRQNPKITSQRIGALASQGLFRFGDGLRGNFTPHPNDQIADTEFEPLRSEIIRITTGLSQPSITAEAILKYRMSRQDQQWMQTARDSFAGLSLPNETRIVDRLIGNPKGAVTRQMWETMSREDRLKIPGINEIFMQQLNDAIAQQKDQGRRTSPEEPQQ